MRFVMSKQLVERLTVHGVHCENCLATIERALKRLEGVFRADAQLQPRAVVVVEYDPEKVNQEVLRRAVEQVGYQVVSQQ